MRRLVCCGNVLTNPMLPVRATPVNGVSACRAFVNTLSAARLRASPSLGRRSAARTTSDEGDPGEVTLVSVHPRPRT